MPKPGREPPNRSQAITIRAKLDRMRFRELIRELLARLDRTRRQERMVRLAHQHRRSRLRISRRTRMLIRLQLKTLAVTRISPRHKLVASLTALLTPRYCQALLALLRRPGLNQGSSLRRIHRQRTHPRQIRRGSAITKTGCWRVAESLNLGHVTCVSCGCLYPKELVALRRNWPVSEGTGLSICPRPS
ncbi:hypothetical protein Thiosp_04042 [Thiorhodovibrio litoralis]|nr:hypothetical protein Thiosp_04042 [Thiorhodovibrio litoralis]